MSYEPVDVFVEDQVGDPVEGVIVRVFNPAGTVAFAQQTTDADGKASFLLFTQQYSMRFYKFHATFPQPQMFEVITAPTVNEFVVHAEIFIPPISNDARFCRCSGYFRNPDGSPQTYLDMHFYPEFAPILVDGAGVVPRTADIRTDESGYAQIDLIRGGCYRVTIEGMDNEDRHIRVPDLASSNLPDVLYAVVARVLLDPPGPYTLAVGAELEVTPVVYDSAGALLEGTASADVDWSTSDNDIAGLSVGQTSITLRGVAAGTAELVATRHDLSIITIPNLPIEGQPINITVS